MELTFKQRYGDYYNPDVELFLKDLSSAGIETVSWTIYWEGDESQFYGDPMFMDAQSYTNFAPEGPGVVVTDIESILYHLTDLVSLDAESGEFELQVLTRTVRQVGDAWMPEPELATRTLDQPLTAKI